MKPRVYSSMRQVSLGQQAKCDSLKFCSMDSWELNVTFSHQQDNLGSFFLLAYLRRDWSSRWYSLENGTAFPPCKGMLLWKEPPISCVGVLYGFGFRHSVFSDVLTFYGFSKVIVYKCRWPFTIWDSAPRLDLVRQAFSEHYSSAVKALWLKAKTQQNLAHLTT